MTSQKELEKFGEKDPREILEMIGKTIMNKAFRATLPSTYFSHLWEKDLSSLDSQDIIDKMIEFLNSNPKDENYACFLFYLTHFPVSMCKRSVSSKLKFLIGFHYRLGVPQKKDQKHINRVSMEELAEIFGRSKATIHECIKETEIRWKNFQAFVKRQTEIEAKAEKELVEEAKARLLKEREALPHSEEDKHTEMKEQTNERPLLSAGGI